MVMERVGDREEKIEGSCSTGQSPQRAVVPVEEEEEAVIHNSKYKVKEATFFGLKNHQAYRSRPEFGLSCHSSDSNN
jgi:hypothetical protein